jgi:polar amino acid transport system substrate-binding protein
MNYAKIIIYSNCLALASLYSINCRAEKLIIGADPWCPMICSEDPEHPGFMVEMAQKALAKHDYQVEFYNLPWSRALLWVEAGKIDGLFGANKSRESIVILPEAAYIISTPAYAVEKRLYGYTWQGDANLGNLRFELVQDMDYAGTTPLGPWLSAHPNQVTYNTGVNSLEKVLSKIHLNRGDITISNLAVLQYNLGKLGLTKHFNIGPIGTSNKAYISISRKHPKAQEIANLLNLEIPLMRKNGELKVILDRYHVNDWE